MIKMVSLLHSLTRKLYKIIKNFEALLAEVFFRATARDPLLIKWSINDVEVFKASVKKSFPDRENISIESFDQSIVHLLFDQASEILNHRVNIFGKEIYLGERINWHKDYINNFIWEEKRYYKRVKPARFPGGNDIKYVWELNRFQHLVRLGQAYWLSKDEIYVKELIVQITQWIEQNPWPWGVNWACTMEVAIRAINWIWAFSLCCESDLITKEFMRMFLASIYQHGVHIKNNLEKYGKDSNNHYLANLLGLVYISLCFPEFDRSYYWKKFSIDEFWTTVGGQFGSDGVNFEGSIAYHRLSLEMVFHAVFLCKFNHVEVPNNIICLLKKMLEFVQSYTKPDGTIPLIGDADDGRILRLSVWKEPEREWLDHRYLLGLGAYFFSRDDFYRSAYGQVQEVIWWFGRCDEILHNPEINLQLTPPSAVFPIGGFAFMRGEAFHASIRFHTNFNHRGHLHNDHMSFELFLNGINWITDLGTYSYTENYLVRYFLRSTRAHNSVVVDGCEINPIEIKNAFWISDRCAPKLLKWESNADQDLLCLEHSVISKSDKIKIRRTFLLLKNNQQFIVMDSFQCSTSHVVDRYIHLSPDCIIVSVGLGFEITQMSTGRKLYCYSIPKCQNYAVQNVLFSPSYGRLSLSKEIRLGYEIEKSLKTVFLIFTEKALSSPDFESICAEIKDHLFTISGSEQFTS